MPIDHTEKGFEQAIEHHLLSNGYIKGNPANFSREYALDPVVLVQFLKDTQPKAWAKLESIHGANVTQEVLKNLHREMKERGSLEVIRHGATDRGVKLKFAYFKPSSGLNEETLLLYQKNILTVTRQVKYSTKNENSVDKLLSLNGFPIATIELKNHLTGQTVENAIWQYKLDRDPKELLFSFKQRALVHFAVDPDEVYMTTKLEGKKTSFLPFNKGDNGGAGNPNVKDNYKTAYLWEEVWEKDSFLEIIARFIHVQKKDEMVDGKKITKETIIFPRYHQLDAVRKLLVASKYNGAGKDYLVQHSAGSGKTNTIAWLAHRLANLHDDKDTPVYSSVVVITDRKVLDQQLQSCIYQFEHQKGVVHCIDKNSNQLAEALLDGGKIIITTLQKFPFVIDKVGELPNRKYAVIVDEAHSSQTGTASAKMKGILGADIVLDEDEFVGIEQLIMQSARSRAKQSNLSFFAFTATPKTKTLEMFGQLGADGKPYPFHLYSMRQAIEEGFILDVLKNYTTYEMYCNIEKAIVDDPVLNKKKAIRAIARWVTLHPYNIAQKTEIIIEHFRQHIRHKLEGKAKAMVVTSSRKAAVRYKLAFDKFINDKGYTDIKTLVAFSGSVSDQGVEYVEPKMNKLKNEEELPEKFNTNEYQVLIVAEKYQTGFDQPLLVAMYVDRKLKGLQAVQTLSRLNRSYSGKDTFVLDFMNDAEDIKTAFKPYYEQTELTDTTDPALLYTARNLLDEFHVFTWEEIDLFSTVFFKPLAEQKEADKGKMHGFLDLAVKRFKELPDDNQREEFRHILYGFLRLYSFLSQIVNFQDLELEKLYAYGRFLASKLPRRTSEKVNINNEVELDKYRINKTFEGTLALQEGEATNLTGMTSIGKGGDQGDSVPLSHIINQINERFGADLNQEDRVYFEQIVVDMGADKKLEEQALVNTIDQFRYGFEKKITDTLISRMEKNEKISGMFLNNPDMRSYISDEIMKEVYYRFRQPPPPSATA